MASVTASARCTRCGACGHEPAQVAGIIGSVDSPSSESVVGTRLALRGWALASNGIQRVDVLVDGRPYRAEYGEHRDDAVTVRPGYPDSAAAGFSFEHDFDDLAYERHDVEIVAIDTHGKSCRLPGFVEPLQAGERPIWEDPW